jgi:hypothetical protein
LWQTAAQFLHTKKRFLKPILFPHGPHLSGIVTCFSRKLCILLGKLLALLNCLRTSTGLSREGDPLSAACFQHLVPSSSGGALGSKAS